MQHALCERWALKQSIEQRRARVMLLGQSRWCRRLPVARTAGECGLGASIRQKSRRSGGSRRPTADDVDRISRGERANRRGTGSRGVPHRLSPPERQSFEVAKRRGFLVLQGSGWRRQRRASPLLNTFLMWCDAAQRPCISVHSWGGGSSGSGGSDANTTDLEQPGTTPAAMLVLDLATLRCSTEIQTQVCSTQSGRVAEWLGVLTASCCPRQAVAGRLVKYVLEQDGLALSWDDRAAAVPPGAAAAGAAKPKFIPTWKLDPRRLECGLPSLQQAKQMAKRLAESTHVWQDTAEKV